MAAFRADTGELETVIPSYEYRFTGSVVVRLQDDSIFNARSAEYIAPKQTARSPGHRLVQQYDSTLRA